MILVHPFVKRISEETDLQVLDLLYRLAVCPLSAPQRFHLASQMVPLAISQL
jgi:hypothetical protein